MIARSDLSLSDLIVVGRLLPVVAPFAPPRRVSTVDGELTEGEVYLASCVQAMRDGDSSIYETAALAALYRCTNRYTGRRWNLSTERLDELACAMAAAWPEASGSGGSREEERT